MVFSNLSAVFEVISLPLYFGDFSEFSTFFSDFLGDFEVGDKILVICHGCVG